MYRLASPSLYDIAGDGVDRFGLTTNYPEFEVKNGVFATKM